MAARWLWTRYSRDRRHPNIEGLGLEHTKVTLDSRVRQSRRAIPTEEPSIFALGDMTGGLSSRQSQ